MAGISAVHTDHVSSLHRLQDYHRSIMREACDIDHMLEEAKDIMFQAKSMVRYRVYSTFHEIATNRIINFNTNLLGQTLRSLEIRSAP